MIDIHNHTLFGVDDGSKSLKQSLRMLEQAKEQGIKSIILTPHYRHGMFSYPLETVQRNFLELNAASAEIGIRLYLGCEYHVNSRIAEYLGNGRCRTLAGSDYVLTEYSFQTEYSYIFERTRYLLFCGYFPVIAHAERYGCLIERPSRCQELQDMGALIQLNADSVLGLAGREIAAFCRRVLKNRWADIIASDAHGDENRVNHLGTCCRHIVKKFDEDYANLLFYQNPRKIIINSVKKLSD